MDAYITVVPIDSDEPGAPTAWFRVYVNGDEILAGTTPAGRPRWFTSLDSAVIAAHAAAAESDDDTMSWIPQYDSAFTEALDEPLGYVGRIDA